LGPAAPIVQYFDSNYNIWEWYVDAELCDEKSWFRIVYDSPRTNEPIASRSNCSSYQHDVLVEQHGKPFDNHCGSQPTLRRPSHPYQHLLGMERDGEPVPLEQPMV
jgi:hypothetical protein